MSDPQDVGPERVPVTAEQLAAGRDALPAAPDRDEDRQDEDRQDEERREAAASHDDAGPEQEQPE